MRNKAKEHQEANIKESIEKSHRDRSFWIPEILKAVALLLLFNLVYTSYYQPKINEQIAATVSDNAQQIVVVNFARIMRETTTKDETLLQKKVAEAIKRLNAEGFIVLDATSILGLHEAYVLETRYIDSINI